MGEVGLETGLWSLGPTAVRAVTLGFEYQVFLSHFMRTKDLSNP